MGRASEQHCQHFRAFIKLGLGLPQIEEYQGYNNREMGNFSTGQYHHGWLTIWATRISQKEEEVGADHLPETF